MSKLKSYILFQACDLIQYERNILDKEERIRDNEMFLEHIYIYIYERCEYVAL